MKYITLLVCACLIQACGSIRITHQWKAESNSLPTSYNKVLVLGLIPEKDRRLQEFMEDHVAGDLTDLGYSATTSLHEFGPKAFEGMDEKTALAKLQNSGIDAVITIVLLNKTRENRYVPGPVYPSYNSVYNFWEYRTSIYNRIIDPGYYVASTQYFWESNFFRMSPQQLLYSIQTKSFDPTTSWSMGHEYGHIITSAMLRGKILSNQSRSRE